MEQNNFEKQVQQKMEQLQLAPSNAAWNNIEKRIAQKKVRRIWIFIWPVVMSLLLLSAYFLAHNIKEKIVPFNKKDNNALVKNQIQKNNLMQENVPALEENTRDSTKNQTAFAEVKLKNHRDSKSTSSINHQQKMNESNLKTGFPVDDLSEDSDKNKIVDDKKIINNKKSLSAQNSDSVNQFVEKNISVASSQNEISKEKIEEQPAFKSEKQKDSVDLNNLSKKVTSKKEASPWKLGFAFSAGRSIAGYEILSQNKSALEYSSPVTSGGGLPNNGYVPSNLTGSLAASAGAFIEKNVLGTNKISIGINYQYFSTKNKVGNQIDSAQAIYFTASQLKNYNNQFHFLQLPVTFKWRLNPKSSLPLYWDASISISQLINTNALQFRSDRGLYYRDNSVFNKTQIGIGSSFSATLFSKKAFPINIGPYFYYGATKLSNKGLYNKTHFSSLGISAQILLDKK